MSELDVSKVKLCAAGNLRRATRALTQLYDDALRPSGLRVTQFSLLVNLARLGPQTMNELADKLAMDRTTLTRNLAPLEREGWVESVTGEDQRTRLVAMTKQGEKVLSKAIPLWAQAQARMVKGIGQERLRNLIKDLTEMTELAQ